MTASTQRKAYPVLVQLEDDNNVGEHTQQLVAVGDVGWPSAVERQRTLAESNG